MSFKKGSKVEVFSKNEVTTGAWLCAEIISGNGHTYRVKYGSFPNCKGQVVDKVPRKTIRPCPPPVKGADDCLPGDLVEAFHNSSWKMARIVKVTVGDVFLVRIIGSSNVWIHKSFRRVRQCWQGDKWFMIGKGSDVVDTFMGEKKMNKKIEQHVGEDCFPVEENTNPKISLVISTRILKRSPYGLYDLEAHQRASSNKRLIEKGGSHQQIYSLHQSSTLEKVDTVVYPNVVLEQNYMNSSFNLATAGFSMLDASSGNDSFVIDRMSLGTDDFTSSVGSCNSIGNDSHNLPFMSFMQHGNNMEDYCSDAESSCRVQYEKADSVHSGEKLGLEHHRSELHMYRSAIQDLYVLGPLSWENEAKLTNLRHLLHISDEEHLMLLRDLISSDRIMLNS